MSSGSQSVVPRPTASVSPRSSQKGKFSSPTLDSLNQKLWGQGPGGCVWTSLPADSDMHWSLRGHAQEIVLDPISSSPVIIMKQHSWELCTKSHTNSFHCIISFNLRVLPKSYFFSVISMWQLCSESWGYLFKDTEVDIYLWGYWERGSSPLWLLTVPLEMINIHTS